MTFKEQFWESGVTKKALIAWVKVRKEKLNIYIYIFFFFVGVCCKGGQGNRPIPAGGQELRSFFLLQINDIKSFVYYHIREKLMVLGRVEETDELRL